MNYNQNYEYEEEIDLVKLILYIFSKWRSIVACVLIGAVLGGTISMFKSNAELTEVIDEKQEINYSKEISIVSSDEAVFDSFIESFYSSGALNRVVEEKYSAVESVKDLISMKSTNSFNVFGATEEETEMISDYLLEAVDEYISVLHGEELKYAVVESDVIEIKNEIVVEAETNKTKEIAIYAFIGAFLGGVVSAGVWFVVFFTGGKLYAVADIEKKFRVKLLGSVAVCEKKNPIDKWLFHKMNGLYSEFSKEEQEKIVLLNIKNELKKNEEIKKVMLVSSLGEEIKEAAQFIRTGLEEAGYTVSDCVNVIGRPDVMESAAGYDAAIVVENTTKSSTKLVAEGSNVIKEYMKNNLFVVML